MFSSAQRSVLYHALAKDNRDNIASIRDIRGKYARLLEAVSVRVGIYGAQTVSAIQELDAKVQTLVSTLPAQLPDVHPLDLPVTPETLETELRLRVTVGAILQEQNSLTDQLIAVCGPQLWGSRQE